MKQIPVIYHSVSAANAFMLGDMKTARTFGQHLAKTPQHDQAHIATKLEVRP